MTTLASAMTAARSLEALLSQPGCTPEGICTLLGQMLLLWLFQSSLASPESYAQYAAVFGNPLVKLILIGLLWAFLHHLLAGLRFLALDVHIGTALEPARASSWAVLVVGIVLTLVLGVWLW